MMKSLKRQELQYDTYRMTCKELLYYGTEGLLLVCLFGYFFYRSVIITILGTPVIYIYIRIKCKEFYLYAGAKQYNNFMK